MLSASFDEGFVGALHDALCANVYPRACRHLAIHHQALPVEVVEVFPVSPVWHQIGIGNQYAGRILMGFENANGFTRLHQQGVVIAKGFEAGNNGIEIFPATRRASNTTVHHQFVRILCHIGMQVVHDHPHWRFG